MLKSQTFKTDSVWGVFFFSSFFQHKYGWSIRARRYSELEGKMFNSGVTVNEISSPSKQDQRIISRKGRSHGMNFNIVQMIRWWGFITVHDLRLLLLRFFFSRRRKKYLKKKKGKQICFNAVKEFHTTDLLAKMFTFKWKHPGKSHEEKKMYPVVKFMTLLREMC